MAYQALTAEEKAVIEKKATEAPFSGQYDNFYQAGIFICRRCKAPLFSSKAKFDAGCGWPAFEQDFHHATKRLMDTDGQRIEIQCANCGAHLGHVFQGEGFTATNTRHCVNSLSLQFIAEGKKLPEVLHE